MRSLLLSLVLVGCVAESEAPPQIEVATELELDDVQVTLPADEEMDVCALAAELPLDDICSLICDPPAMAARLVEDGSDKGSCYQLYCALPGDEHVLVGVCLPP